MTRNRTLVLALALLLAGVVSACGEKGDDTGASQSQTAELEAYDYYFEPTSITVGVGADVTVEFTNNGSVAHSFTSPDLDVDLEVDTGNDGTVSFSAPAEPGSFDFYCRFHPDDMQGTISVGGADEPAEEAPATDNDDEDVDVDVNNGDDDDSGGGY